MSRPEIADPGFINHTIIAAYYNCCTSVLFLSDINYSDEKFPFLRYKSIKVKHQVLLSGVLFNALNNNI